MLFNPCICLYWKFNLQYFINSILWFPVLPFSTNSYISFSWKAIFLTYWKCWYEICKHMYIVRYFHLQHTINSDRLWVYEWLKNIQNPSNVFIQRKKIKVRSLNERKHFVAIWFNRYAANFKWIVHPTLNWRIHTE